MALLDRWNHFWSKRVPLRSRFRRIYRKGGFGGTAESASGVGSTLEATSSVRAGLSDLLRELRVKTLLDAPCGDFHWMKHVDLGSASYVGVDIVPEVVRESQSCYEGARRSFRCADLRGDPLPPADVVLCRDCLVHLSNRDAMRVLDNLLRTGADWFLVTTFPDLQLNRDLVSGLGWRPLNLQLAPFHLPVPQLLLSEQEQDEAGNRKALGLWSRAAVLQARQCA